jgi:hypothetical protein
MAGREVHRVVSFNYLLDFPDVLDVSVYDLQDRAIR